MRLADYVMQYLADKGVKHVFYLPGGGAMYLVDALGCNHGLMGVRCLHEQVAGVAADVYAQIKGLGVCLVTSGPGATNAITACAAAWTDSCPTIFISGQVRREQLIGETGIRMRGGQEVDIIPMVQCITKYSLRVMNPEYIRIALDRAVFSATHGRRGPVWLDIPQDVQAAEIDPDNLAEGNFLAKHLPVPDVSGVIADLLQARRPVIVAGAGILPHDAEFRALARRLNVPVLTTYRMYGLFNWDDPLWFGRPGTAAIPYASRILQNADFILSIGTRMSWNMTGYNLKDFAPYVKKWYAVDIDQAELNKHARAIKMLADAGDFIEEMLRVAILISDEDWLYTCQSWKKNYLMPWHDDDPQEIARRASLSGVYDVIAPATSGICGEGFYQGWHCKEGQYFHFLPDFGAMGFGLAGAIGACFAYEKKKGTLCIEGDGGYLLNQSAWDTVEEYDLPIWYRVLANGSYGSIEVTEDNYFEGRRMGSQLPHIDKDIIRPVNPNFRLPRPPVRMIDGMPQASTIEETLEWPEPQPVQK